MRLLAVLPNYPPGQRVGAWLATHGFLAHLAGCGNQVTVFAYLSRLAPYTIDGVGVETCLHGRSHARRLADAADVILGHAGDDGLARSVAAQAGVPWVVMAHSGISDPAIFAGSALVVFNSHTLAASVDCPVPWIVCHPPVHADLYRATPGERVTLVNLSEAKGGELFWRLVRCSTRQFLGVKGWGAQYVDGRYSNAEVIATTLDMPGDVYSRTRILLMPSLYESYGMVGVEALASGIPVIASNLPGLHESLGDAGTFVDRDDPYAWLDHIERLHQPGEWTKASRLSLARSAELDPTEDLNRFTGHIEALASVQCVA